MENLTRLISKGNSSMNGNFSAIILFALLFTQGAFAQNNKEIVGISVSSSVTGIGFGTVYSPGLFLSKGKKLFEAGVTVQKRNLNLSGVRMNYEYTVFDGATSPCREYANENLELYFFTSAVYHHSAYLGKAQMRLEKQINKESTIKLDQLTYTAAEVYGGFGMRIKLGNRFKWVNSMGVGGWHTLKGETNLDRSQTDVSLLFNTKLMFRF